MEHKPSHAPISEKDLKAINGLWLHIFNIIIAIVSCISIVFGLISYYDILIVLGILYLVTVFPFGLCAIRKLGPNEAFVLMLFGKYHGTLKGPGFLFVNPFSSAFIFDVSGSNASGSREGEPRFVKNISLKTKTFSNQKQKINDLLGNPVLIDTVVVWRITDTAKAAFDVDNYLAYLSAQCESSLRSIVSLYPYDTPVKEPGSETSDERTLRGSSQEISQRLKTDIQAKVEVAGLEIIEARITNLSYAPEIAAAMLQRQQASAIVDAKHTIVEAAVDMVHLALRRLEDNNIVNLDEERKAAMVGKLLVVLCGSRDAQPVINSD